MSHPLIVRIRSIKRQARRLVLLHALAIWFAVFLTAAMTIGLLDFLFRVQDPGVRWIESAGLWLIGAWAFYRFVYAALRFRQDDVQAAYRIERCLPDLADRLSTAVAFLRESESPSQHGSPSLRQWTVRQVWQQVRARSLQHCLDRRPIRRATAFLAVATIVMGAVWLSDRSVVEMAACRLAMPWNDQYRWPRRNELAFVDPPSRLAIGDSLVLELVDHRGPIPEEVEFQYRFLDDASHVLRRPMKPWGEKMLVRLERVDRSFEFRAEGGDDRTMEWLRLDVVEPPHLEELSIVLYPPPYTGLPPRRTGRHLEAWEGTKVRIRGRASEPLRQLEFVARLDEGEWRRAAELDADGRTFRIPGTDQQPWALTASGRYYLELTTRDHFVSRELENSGIRVHRDMPPTVSVVSPLTDSPVTREAVVPVRAVIKDDLAVQRVVLRAPEIGWECVLDDGRRRATQSGPADQSNVSGETRTVTYPWDLRELPELADHQTLEFVIAAVDGKPQEGVSPTIRLRLIGHEELQSRMDSHLMRIAERLRRALASQRAARTQIESLQIQFQETGHILDGNVEELQSAHWNQQHVVQALVKDQDSAASIARWLLDQLRNNRMHHPQLEARIQRLATTLQSVGEKPLPAIEHELTQCRKIIGSALEERRDEGDEGEDRQAGAEVPDELSERTAVAVAEQAEVIETLERLLGQLVQWEDYRELARDLEALRERQAAIAEDTLRSPTMGQDVRQLSSQQRADLKRLALRQLEAARMFEQIRLRLDETRAALADTDPLAAETLTAAIRSAADSNLGTSLRDAASHLEANRLGEATRQQQESLQALDELLDVMANRSDKSLEQMIPQLDQSVAEVQRVLDAQRELAERVDRAASTDDQDEQLRQLAAHGQAQSDLAQRTRSLASRVAPNQGTASSQSLMRAGEAMEQSAQAARRAQAASARNAARQAVDELQEAYTHLKRRTERARQQWQQELRMWIARQIPDLQRRQTLLRDETAAWLRGHETATNAPELDVALHQRQQQWAVDTDALAARADGLPAVQFALEYIGATGHEAARAMESPQDATRTTAIQQRAIDQLTELQAALREPEGSGHSEGSSETSDGTDSPSSKSLSSSDIQLIRSMQLDILRATQRAADQLTEQPDNLFLKRQISDLARRQSELAQLVGRITTATEAATPPEPEPEVPRGQIEQELEKALEEAGIPEFGQP